MRWNLPAVAFPFWLAGLLAGCSHLSDSGRPLAAERADASHVNPVLGEETWGIACVSVASGREQPDNKAEMGTQVLMGHAVRLRAMTRLWAQVESADDYLSWLEKGTFVRCRREQVDQWNQGPLLIVTALEDAILERPEAGSQAVSDIVIGDLVRKVGEEGEWFKVRLPDEREGFVPRKSVEEFASWKRSRRATPESIERTARTLMGRPYLWGGNSPKGLDCSGLTKLTFFLNGIELSRNASQQARLGTQVEVDGDLSRLRKGDLLCFGFRARAGRPERVTHVGIYLGDKLFIQSSQRVRISSLDPNSPIRDEFRIRTLLFGRRILRSSNE
jgi:cell wall-associated NlpC family hydrolase